jgi:Subtilase family
MANDGRKPKTSRTTDSTEQVDFTVHLGTVSFDPVTTAKQLATKSKRAPMQKGAPTRRRPKGALDPADTRIVQLTGTISKDEITRLKAEYGLALTHYIPNHAYVERVDADTRLRLEQEPVIRALAPYLPEYKLPLGLIESADRAPLEVKAILFDQGDPALVKQALVDAGVAVTRATDDRLHGGLVQITFVARSRTDLLALTAMPDVRFIEPCPMITLDDVGASSIIQSGNQSDGSIWSKGLHGEGQVITIYDEGPFDIAHCFFSDSAVPAPGPTHRKVIAIRNASAAPPSSHGTFVAGVAAGDEDGNSGNHGDRGTAWAAKLIYVNFDFSGSSHLQELVQTKNLGSFIHSNSWHLGPQGPGNPAPYDQTDIDVDQFAWDNEEQLLIASAGNSSNEQGSPGSSKNTLCIAASKGGSNATEYGNGNPGPTSDGRRKPDLMAVGELSSAVVGTGCITESRTPATSWATPNAAGAAALVRQYFTEGWHPGGTKVPTNGFTPSGALIKAVMLNSTVDLTGVPDYPNDKEGWGMLRLDQALAFPGGRRRLAVYDTPNLIGLSSGESVQHRFNVEAGTEQLKITLVWTDRPNTAGTPATSRKLVNQLMLLVESPINVFYRGNDFTNNVSTEVAEADLGTRPGDILNNVHMVVVNSPAVGTWVMSVDGVFVPAGDPGQGYALVVSAALKEPKKGCFVATTVYDDAFHPDVVALRGWRDRLLEQRGLRGSAMWAFTAGYDRVGPIASQRLTHHPRIKRALRTKAFPHLIRVLTKERS